jgi:hypothetical protein
MGNFISGQRTLPREAGVIVNLYFEKPPGEPARLVRPEFVPTWVQFRNNSGEHDITVLPIVDMLNIVDNDEEHNLRPQDITRMRNALRDAINIYGIEFVAGVEEQ